MNKWTVLAPDDIETMISHVTTSGYLDDNGAILVNFEDFCNLLRKFLEQSAEVKKLRGAAQGDKK
jgi:hypothetical protein